MKKCVGKGIIEAFKVNIEYFTDATKEDFLYETNKYPKSLTNKLFHVDNNSSRLNVDEFNMFHVLTMKCVFLC